jgi:hypothetical protein
MCEDEVGCFGRLGAGEAGIHNRRIASPAIGVEVSESPAAGRRVLG